MTTGHLKCEYLLIRVRNMQNCEMPKIDIFLQVRGHENLQIFRLSGKGHLKKNESFFSNWPAPKLKRLANDKFMPHYVL